MTSGMHGAADCVPASKKKRACMPAIAIPGIRRTVQSMQQEKQEKLTKLQNIKHCVVFFALGGAPSFFPLHPGAKRPRSLGPPLCGAAPRKATRFFPSLVTLKFSNSTSLFACFLGRSLGRGSGRPTAYMLLAFM